MSRVKGTSLDIGVSAISRTAGRGNVNASYHNILKGKNWSGAKPFLEQPKDRTGVIFCARTDMNLCRDNIKGHRHFESLLSTNRKSTGRAIQAILDPRLSRRTDSKNACPLVDPFYGFNPLCDNTIVSCTGWPNNVVNASETAPNVRGASTMLIEGRHQGGKSFNLSVEHLNTEGDMLSQMYSVMTRYPQLVRAGEMHMYDDNVVLDRVDWKTRLYRFIFDKTGHRVEQFTMTGEAFPVSDSTGNAMNFTNDTSQNEGYETVSAQWKCGGYFHNDPIVIDEFNKTQEAHYDLMKDEYRETELYRIGADEGRPSLAVADIYQYIGYPRINPLTLEFEIWVPNLIKTILGEFDSVEEFSTAMMIKNDADLYYGTSEYDAAALYSALGVNYGDLPEMTTSEGAVA